jgi:hypothetical protein
MAKQSGLGDNFYVGGYDLSGDTSSLSRVGGSQAIIDVTGIDKSAFERIGGQRDGSIEWVSFFNDSTGQAHATLKTLPTADVVAEYARGTTLGNQAACIVAKQINYDPTRANSGELTVAVQAQANGFGLEWGNQLTAGKRTDTTATAGTAVDFTAATSFGWQAYLQVFAFTGTSVTVTLEDSANNSVFATLSGAVFTAATGVTTQRLASSSGTATVRQYVRATTSGTFSSATFAVVLVKNESLVTF